MVIIKYYRKRNAFRILLSSRNSFRDTSRPNEWTSAYMSDHVRRDQQRGTKLCPTQLQWQLTSRNLPAPRLLMSSVVCWCCRCHGSQPARVAQQHPAIIPTSRDHVARTLLPDERPTDRSDFVTRAKYYHVPHALASSKITVMFIKRRRNSIIIIIVMTTIFSTYFKTTWFRFPWLQILHWQSWSLIELLHDYHQLQCWEYWRTQSWRTDR